MFHRSYFVLAMGLLGVGVAACGPKTPPVTPPATALLTQEMNLKDQVSIPLENGCVYRADVRGKVVPAGADAFGQPAVRPNLSVAAEVACPNASVIHRSRSVLGPAPMTRAQLVAAIEQRASVATAVSGQTCYYAPDFALTSKRLVGNGVAYVCAIPSK
jgi:hypothetical protein